MFDVLLDIVLEPKVSSDDKVNEEILKSCFIVLQKIARKNERVSDKINDHYTKITLNIGAMQAFY